MGRILSAPGTVLYKLLSRAAFGWNERLYKMLADFHDEAGLPKTFAFYEYFFSRPLSRDENGDTGDVLVLAPFATRLAERLTMRPKVSANGDRTLSYGLATKRQPPSVIWGRLTDDAPLALNLFDMWRNNSAIPPAGTAPALGTVTLEGHRSEFPRPYGGFDPMFWLTGDGFSVEEFKNTTEARIARMTENDSLTPFGASVPLASALLEEVGLFDLHYPYLTADVRIPFCSLPIASNDLFYGMLWVWMPSLLELDTRATPNDQNGRGEKLDRKLACLERLVRLMGPIARQQYAPGLALLHNHFLEGTCAELIDAMDTGDDGDRANATAALDALLSGASFSLGRARATGLRTKNVFVTEARRSESIEKGLAYLWRMRNRSPREDPELKESLVFRNYLVCSPRMIGVIGDVMTAGLTLRQTDKTLATALVVGGAGSGKEKVSKMLRLFTAHHHRGIEYVINMASIRPSPITGPAMMGISKLAEPFKFSGILNDVREKTWEILKEKVGGDLTQDAVRKIAKDAEKAPPEYPEYPFFPTIILDELNSMDSDSQGTLLRFLENSELVAIGDIEDKGKEDHGAGLPLLTNCLIIGIMNEDPDDITRERAVEFAKASGYLGGLLGDWLYEGFMKMRRLRPDLKYRMVRGGKFELPQLSKRREDIPLMFSIYLEKELSASSPTDPTPDIPVECYELLMSPTLAWPGNVRQLQAVAKRTAQLIQSSDEKDVPVSIQAVRIALKESGLENGVDEK